MKRSLLMLILLGVILPFFTLPARGSLSCAPQIQGLSESYRRFDGERDLGAHGGEGDAHRARGDEEHYHP